MKQTNKQTDRQIDRQTDRQTEIVRAEEEVKANKMLNPWGEKISLILTESLKADRQTDENKRKNLNLKKLLLMLFTIIDSLIIQKVDP